MLPLSLLTVAILIQSHCVESLCSNSEGESIEIDGDTVNMCN